jgi:hypothetical protein
MEIEKTTTERHYSIGLTINEAIKQPLKVGVSKDEDLNKAFVFCFAMIGLNEDQYPKGLRRSILTEFVRSNYRFHSVEEIKTAFIMLVKGDFGDKKPNHYNNFSPEYFGSVMALYKTHRENAKIHLLNIENKKAPEKPYIPNSIERIKIQREFDEVVLTPIFQNYKLTGKIHFGATPSKIIYNSLVGFHKVIEFTNEQKKEIKTQAIKVLNDKREDLENGKAKNYIDHKKKIETLGNLVKAEFLEDEIIKECHIICILKCFQRMETTNFKF